VAAWKTSASLRAPCASLALTCVALYHATAHEGRVRFQSIPEAL
jgi:hypothetical protein